MLGQKRTRDGTLAERDAVFALLGMVVDTLFKRAVRLLLAEL